MNYTLLSTCYFPPVSYIRTILSAENVMIEQYENFSRKSLRNRCKIYGANGVINLSIPITKSSAGKQLIKDTKIDYSINWQKQHFKSIESAYKSSPFYMYLIDDYMIFFTKQFKYLLDFNLQILHTILDFLEVDVNIGLTESYEGRRKTEDGRRKMEDRRRKTEDGRWKTEDRRRKTGDGRRKTGDRIPQYYQVFADKYGFKEDLSVIDLLFNLGNEAYSYLLRK